MPAVQSKINIDGRAPADEDNVKARCHLKTRNKDRSTSYKYEATGERTGQLKRKRNIVPELDLKALSPRGQGRKNNVKIDSGPRASKTVSGRTAAAKAAKKRQLEGGNANSKANLLNKPLMHSDICMDEIKTSRSLYYLSARQEPNHSFADVENINPNQLRDNFFECNEVDDFFRTQFPDFESSSEFEFQTPKNFDCKDFDLQSVDSVMSYQANSPGVLRHFKELLNQEENSRTNLLEQSEIALLKDIIKADEQHQKLRKDDYNLLKDILKGQLKEITQQERVIKMALKKIRSQSDEVEVTTMKVDAAEQPMENSARVEKSTMVASARSTSIKPVSLNNSARTISARISSNKSPRQEVDVIFKNVPTLENEIRILRTLGHKLEETLKKSADQSTSTRERQTTLILHTVQVRYFTHRWNIASLVAFPLGIRVTLIVAQEFQIRHQTIDELKLEGEFYIPTDLDRFTLQQTNFNKLSRNPELLLRRLKPNCNDTKMRFNFIEQDPIFFNHFIAKMCKICSDPVESHETYIPKSVNALRNPTKIISVKRGSGDHLLKEETKSNLEVPVPKEITPSKQLLNQKKKRKRTLTPSMEKDQVTAKNSLLRTVLLGTLQLSILFTVVTAVLYPDLICL